MLNGSNVTVRSVYIRIFLATTVKTFTSSGKSSEAFGGIPAPSIIHGFFDDNSVWTNFSPEVINSFNRACKSTTNLYEAKKS